jgi:hypothetical protein
MAVGSLLYQFTVLASVSDLIFAPCGVRRPDPRFLCSEDFPYIPRPGGSSGTCCSPAVQAPGTYNLVRLPPLFTQKSREFRLLNPRERLYNPASVETALLRIAGIS